MYGLLITLSVLSALFLSERLAREKNLNLELFWNVSFWTILGGVVGARIYHVIDFWEVYSQNIWSIFYIWYGGLGIFGAIIGGLLVFTSLLRKKRENLKNWLDVIALPLPLAQSIGRWGNYFNNEILPYALYESAADFVLFLLLFVVYKKFKKPGFIFLSYIFGYSVIRIILEPLKLDSWTFYTFNVAQTVSLLLVIISVILALRWKNEK